MNNAIVLMSGFEIFHLGHLNALENSRKIAERPVVIIVMRPDFPAKNSDQVIPLALRAEMVMAAARSIGISVEVFAADFYENLSYQNSSSILRDKGVCAHAEDFLFRDPLVGSTGVPLAEEEFRGICAKRIINNLMESTSTLKQWSHTSYAKSLPSSTMAVLSRNWECIEKERGYRNVQRIEKLSENPIH